VRIFDTERQIIPSERCCRCRVCAFDSGCCATETSRKGSIEKGREEKERGRKKNKKNQYIKIFLLIT